MWLYNPGAAAISVTAEFLNTTTGVKITKSYNVPARDHFLIPDVIQTGTGVNLRSVSTFLPLHVSDTEQSAGPAIGGTLSWGEVFDWGIPVLPKDTLTTQVLVGWG